jgi:hypothetical protein
MNDLLERKIKQMMPILNEKQLRQYLGSDKDFATINIKTVKILPAWNYILFSDSQK